MKIFNNIADVTLEMLSYRAAQQRCASHRGYRGMQAGRYVQLDRWWCSLVVVRSSLVSSCKIFLESVKKFRRSWFVESSCIASLSSCIQSVSSVITSFRVVTRFLYFQAQCSLCTAFWSVVYYSRRKIHTR